jgi:cytidine deaminase
MRVAGERAFEAVLAGFPEAARPPLSQLPHQTGRLNVEDVDALCQALNLTPQTLALALLPLAQSFARPEISGFSVGAVAVAGAGDALAQGSPEAGKSVLFLGANLEFHGLPLCFTIHAEQAAVLSAWHGKAHHLQALAVSAPPCGACRQFLMEATARHDLTILIPSAVDGCRRTNLAALLPEAFGPDYLNKEAGLFDHAPTGFNNGSNPVTPERMSDPMIRVARVMAESSYAPYTNNLAGCALRLADGAVVAGGCLESAAYNPGLTALQSTLAMASLRGAHLPEDIERVVLAERPTTARQTAAAELLLSTWAPGAEFISHLF